MTTARCNSCQRYVDVRGKSGHLYGSTKLGGFYSDGQPYIIHVWRFDCYGGCTSVTQAPATGGAPLSKIRAQSLSVSRGMRDG